MENSSDGWWAATGQQGGMLWVTAVTEVGMDVQEELPCLDPEGLNGVQMFLSGTVPPVVAICPACSRWAATVRLSQVSAALVLMGMAVAPDHVVLLALIEGHEAGGEAADTDEEIGVLLGVFLGAAEFLHVGHVPLEHLAARGGEGG